MSDFATELKAQLESTPDLRRRGQRVLNMLNARPSKRRTRFLEKAEAHARAELGKSLTVQMDWSLKSIDWLALLKVLLPILLALLTLL